jgi:hypothetical protein
MEIDHIVPRSEGGGNDIDNAIPVCFECHAEIHLYNDKHPRGRKFSSDELRKHKKEWLSVCSRHPEILAESLRTGDVGPLQALTNELEFNSQVAQTKYGMGIGCQFELSQFNRTISEGLLSLLTDELRDMLIEAYAKMKKANLYLVALSQTPPEGNAYAVASNNAQTAVLDTKESVKNARVALERFLVAEKGMHD